MDDVVLIVDTDGVEHCLSKACVSEIEFRPKGCVFYASGHPVVTSMGKAEAVALMDVSGTQHINELVTI